MTDLVTTLEQKANDLRIHSIMSTAAAGSGHPTTCMSCAEIISTLFFHAMRYDPKNPDNPNNDRFILSKGHAAPILYAAWAELGIISRENLLDLRKIDSDLEGHPTPRLDWIDVATGSLGQGLSVGVGMAINSKYLDKTDYRVYVLLGDGETVEGSVWEAVALASHYQLNNLIGIVDVNGIGQSQRTMYESDIDSYCRRFESFGWRAIGVDGHNVEQILSAIDHVKGNTDQPTMIVAKTFKGKGVSFLEDADGWHGKAILGDQLDQALEELGQLSTNSNVEIEMPSMVSLPTPEIGEMEPPDYQIGEEVATRSGYGTALAKLGDVNPLVVALDGDTKNSTYAQELMTNHSDRYFEMFIAEQNLVGAGIGLSKRGKIPFVSTFAAFFSRAYDHIRMSAISQANIKYVGSHCGISIGEDGPSQMGLEDLSMFRSIPNAAVLYPSDAVATERLVAEAAAYEGIVFIRTSRPNTKIIYENSEQFPIGGSKVVRSSGEDQITVVAAGITLHQALKAYDQLQTGGISIRVIDLYSVKPVDIATLVSAAKETGGTIITVEDHYPEGGIGEAVLSAVGSEGIKVHKLAVNSIPRSGKQEELLEVYGISTNHIVQTVKALI
ncbi:TPA: transketolase [Candidatus Poribacteria bacterium]|nr:transketolase [Candidatus Poribacteria bacterium]HIA70294.1 transketolase [Candidatus Poribacteria bacterium]HIB92244.1 transketolase [Candidatus Poribacteria bacterium]HIC00800.1 transketolase [Candidatus Poribacteria bacterium]HIO09439.1 transketolase [Candidatus Poribacteria bacterium]